MKYLSFSGLLLVAGMVSAQDMPLSEILRPGEAWQLHAGEVPVPQAGGYRVDRKQRTIVLDRRTNKAGEPQKHPLKEPISCVVALGGSTLLVTDAADRYVWALRIEKDGTLGPGDRYARLRVTGDDRRRKGTPADLYKANPSAITIDGANRTYVATNLGIQVFDPTGRLCGVITAPPGRVTELRFDGDRLLALADRKVYVRRMLAEGRK